METGTELSRWLILEGSVSFECKKKSVKTTASEVEGTTTTTLMGQFLTPEEDHCALS